MLGFVQMTALIAINPILIIISMYNSRNLFPYFYYPLIASIHNSRNIFQYLLLSIEYIIT